MEESRPFVIYSLYFDASLTRSEGRRVSIRNAVRNPKTEEILKVARSICIRVERTSKNHPTRWSNNSGGLLVNYKGKKTELLSGIASGLKTSRKTD